MDRDQFSPFSERDFAFWFENAPREDPAVLRILVDRYAEEILWLTEGMLDLLSTADNKKENTLEVCTRVFQRAWSQVDQFRGHDNVRIWLIKILVQEIRKNTPGKLLLDKLKPEIVGVIKMVRSPEAIEAGIPLQVDLGALNRVERIVLFLRFTSGMNIGEIAYTLRIPPQKVSRLLVEARQKIGVAFPHADLHAENDERHKRALEYTDSILDGYTEPWRGEEQHLKSHLLSCSLCRQYSSWRERVDEILVQSFQEHWSKPDLTTQRKQQLYQRALRISRIKNPWKEGRRHLPEGILITLVLAVMIVIGIYFSNQDVEQGAVLIRPSPEVTPTAVQADAAVERRFPGLDETNQGSSEFIHYSELDLSANAQKMVYTQERTAFLMGRYTSESEIYLLDLVDGTKELVSTGDSRIDASGPSQSPSISRDGNRVVFASHADNLLEGDLPSCPLGRTDHCIQIYLKDLTQDSLLRISTTPDGKPANSHSALPVISADGRWVAYWSAATNLTPDEDTYCRQESPTHYCWNIYLHDLHTSKTTSIPIGRTDQPYDLQLTDKLSLSGDGQLLTLSLHRSDHLAAELGVQQTSEAYLYDLQKEEFIILNVSSQGEPGDGSSAKPVISEDGRYIAFASQASNLVEEDDNMRSDVFLYEVSTGKVELISKSLGGEHGFGDSGTRFQFELSWLERMDISADGRYVIFMSTAENLRDPYGNTCPSESWYPCFNIYIYDRLTNQIDQPMKSPNYTYLIHSPSISADGHLAAFVRYDQFCSEVPYCSSLILYDRKTSEISFRLGREDNISTEGGDELPSSTLASQESSSVNCLQFSPAGDMIATGSNDGSVILWSVKNQAPIATLKAHTLPVSGVAFSPDGTRLASGSQDGNVIIWRLLDGTPLAELRSYTGAILSLAFSPDGGSLAVGAVGAAWIWELSSGDFNLVGYFPYPREQVHDMSYSQDGRLLAHAVSDGSIWVRRSSDGELLTRLAGHQSEVLSVSFSTGGDFLASGSKDGAVNVWHNESKSTNNPEFNRILILRHADWVNDLAFSPTGDLLAVAAFHSNLPLWRLPEGELLSDNLGSRWFQSKAVGFSSQGDRLVVGSAWGSLQLFELQP